MTSDPKENDHGYTSTQKIDYEEIATVREYFRENDYLMSPLSSNIHTSVDKRTKLSDELSEFTNTAIANKNEYFQALLKKESSSPLRPVCITQQEVDSKNLISNKTKSEILKEIMKQLDLMSDKENSKLLEEYFNKSVKSKNKDAYIEFYYTISDEM